VALIHDWLFEALRAFFSLFKSAKVNYQSLLHNDFRIQPLDPMALWVRRLNSLFLFEHVPFIVVGLKKPWLLRPQSYKIAERTDSRKIAEFLSRDGQLLLPFLELVCNTEQAVDELIDVAGKAAIEAVLLLSAQQVAGPKQPGKAHGQITWYGRQRGVVSLSQRKLRVEKPRLRKKGKGCGKEVAVPAYEALVMNSLLGRRILEILMKGVSTRWPIRLG